MYKKIQYLISIGIVILMSSMPISSSLQLNLTYDPNGNLIFGDGKYREYNEFNQLVRVREGNSSSGDILEEYIFHPMEDRIFAKRVYQNSTLKEIVIYPDENLVRTVTFPNGPNGNSVNTSDRIYVKDENGIVAEFNPNQSKAFYLNDHLGSTSVVTNSTGGIIEETLYEPFGGIISGGGVRDRFYYEGKEFSQTTDDYDFHFRKYDPELMIFTQPDSIMPDPYNPQSLNKYGFELGNPYKYTDPDGHFGVIGILVAFAFVVAVSQVISFVQSYSKGAGFSNSYEAGASSAGQTIGKIVTSDSGLASFAAGVAGAGTIGSFIGSSAGASSVGSVGGSGIGVTSAGSSHIGSQATSTFKSVVGGVDDVSRTGRSTAATNVLSKTTSIQKIQHIISNPTHNWYKVVDDPNDWNQVSSVIDDVIKTGTKSPHGKTPGVFESTKIVNGKEVVVRYREGYDISTAYVK